MNRIERYFKSEDVSQSHLKIYSNNNPRAVTRKKPDKKNLYYDEKRQFTKGSLTDVLITMPEEFENLYYVQKTKLPSEALVSITKYVWDKHDHTLSEVDPKLILEAYTVHEYQSRQKDETKVNGFWKNCTEYWSMLQEAGDKQIISESTLEICKKAKHALLNSKYTKKYFQADNPFIEILYQVDIYFEYMGVNCKALLDMVKVDHKAKTIQLIDIKTCGAYLEDFHRSIKKFRYDIQLAFYNIALKTKYPEYTILHPLLLAVSMKEPDYAEPFTFTEDDLKIALDGSLTYPLYTMADILQIKRETPVLGVNQLMERYKSFDESVKYNAELLTTGINTIKIW